MKLDIVNINFVYASDLVSKEIEVAITDDMEITYGSEDHTLVRLDRFLTGLNRYIQNESSDEEREGLTKLSEYLTVEADEELRILF